MTKLEVKGQPKLKECPFCGHKAKLMWDFTTGDFSVCCPECGCVVGEFTVQKDAVKAWNTRKGER